MVNMPWAITPGSPTPVAKRLVPVDGVEVAGGAGVFDQVRAGDLDGAAADVLADGEFVEVWGSWLLSLSADQDG